MRRSNFFYIVIGHLTERKWQTVFAVMVIALAVIVALTVTAVTNGMLRGLQKQAGEMFPPTTVMVKPKTVGLAMLAFNTSVIDDTVVKAVESLSGVTEVQPQLSVRVPLRMEVEVGGQYAVTDAVVVGVDPAAFEGKLRLIAPFQYDDQTSQPIPCIVPRMLLDIYNLAYSDSMGLPKLNEDFLLGKRFTMVLGETYLVGGPGGKSDKLLCRVTGIVADPSLVPGVYVPMEYARRLNYWYSGNNEQPYTAMQVLIDRADRVEEVVAELSALGLSVEGNQMAYDSITFATRAGTWLLYIFVLVTLLMAAFGILNLFALIMSQRVGEMQLLTVVGATRGALRRLYFAEALMMAVVGIVIGGVFTVVILRMAESRIHAWLTSLNLENLSVVPERFFAFDFLSISGVLILILCISVAAPLFLTWRVTGRYALDGR